MTTTLADVEAFLDSHQEACDRGKPASNEQITRAEVVLGLCFPDEYRQFLKTWGTLAVGPIEIYGIAGDELLNARIPNGIGYTIRQRKVVGLPHHLIMLWNNEGDEFYCLDAADPSRSRVVVWDAIQHQIRKSPEMTLFDFIVHECSDCF